MDEKFPLGACRASALALECLAPWDMMMGLERHERGDWGDLPQSEFAENEFALAHGLRLVSSYHSVAGIRFLVITEGDRSETTIFLPEEYPF